MSKKPRPARSPLSKLFGPREAPPEAKLLEAKDHLETFQQALQSPGLDLKSAAWLVAASRSARAELALRQRASAPQDPPPET